MVNILKSLIVVKRILIKKVMLEPQFENYMVISDSNISLLCEDIVKFLKMGWICQGGICVFDTPSSVRYYQAMVKPVTK